MADWAYGLSQGIAAGARAGGGLIDASLKEEADVRAADKRLADAERLAAAQEAMQERIAESAYQRQQRPSEAAGALLRDANAPVAADPEYKGPAVNVSGTPDEVRAKLAAIPDPAERAIALQSYEQQEAAKAAAVGKTRAPTRDEQIKAAMEAALQKGDAVSYERLKVLAGDKYMPLSENGMLNTGTGEIIGGGTSKADRERERDERQFEYKLRLQREEEQGRDARAEKAASNAVARDEAKVGRESSKPLPGPALAMQQKGLEAIGTSSGIQKDIDRVAKQIDDGKLNFGLTSNMVNKAKNYTGNSDEESRNFGSFQSTMEKMRNDSLRLNAGVQTDGDAQRAWKELFDNINDKEYVRQRLDEIKDINARGVILHKLNIDNIRSNYSKEPFDFSKYESAGDKEKKPAGRPSLDEIFK